MRLELRFVEYGLPMQVRKQSYDAVHGQVFHTEFYAAANPPCFWLKSEELYNSFPGLGVDTHLNITFDLERRSYRFSGELKGTRQEDGAYLTLLEQIEPIEEVSVRRDSRTEMRLEVSVYGLIREPRPHKASEIAEMSCEVFDISAGGLCLVSNEYFHSPFEPYFMLEFNFRGKGYFLLPAQLVRKGSCPQTVLFAYDYGFNFLYDDFPGEKERLAAAIFDAQLEQLR